MMALQKLRNEIRQPLGECKNMLPKVVSHWNHTKGPIDDLSKVLSHNIGKFGPISPMNVIWVRYVSTMLYNAWRLYALSAIAPRLNTFKSYEHFQRERIRIGGTFDSFLKALFDCIYLPATLSDGVSITSPSACNAQNVCSGLSPINNNERVKRSLWNNESYVMLRLDGDENHVPIDIESHENKRQRTENGSKKRKPTRACKFCSFTIRCEESNKFQKKNIFDKHVYKKSSKQCLKCNVALCTNFCPYTSGRYANKTCFELFHTVPKLQVPEK